MEEVSLRPGGNISLRPGGAALSPFSALGKGAGHALRSRIVSARRRSLCLPWIALAVDAAEL
jgi:hypothetical protein